MGKTVYLTQEQVDKLRKIVTEEEKLNMPVDIEPGDNVLDKISDKKAEITNVAGSQVADNTNFTIAGMEVEGKRYSKKQIEEAKVRTIIGNNPKYSKKDFSKRKLKNG